METPKELKLSEINDSNVTWTLMTIARLIRAAEFGSMDVLSMVGGFVPGLLRNLNAESIVWKNYVLSATSAEKVTQEMSVSSSLKIVDDAVGGYRRSHNTLTPINP